MFIFERESVSGEGAERVRERETGSEVDSVLTAESPMQGWKPQMRRLSPELKLDAQLTEPPRRFSLTGTL